MEEDVRLRIDAIIDEIKALLARKDEAALIAFVEDQHPADLAEAFSSLTEEERKTLFDLLPSELAADIVEELETEYQTEIMNKLEVEQASDIITAMESDDATDLLSELEEQKQDDILSNLDKEEAEEFQELLSYEDDSSGGIMGTECIALSPNMKVDYALDFIRRTGKEAQTLNDIYVVDPDERIVGVLSLRDIVVANPLLKIGEIMHRKVVKVGVNVDQEEAAMLFKKYGVSAIPVVDDQDRLTGIITADDILHVVDEEATEDIQKMAGVISNDDTYMSTKATRLWSSRIIWLVVLFLADLSSGFIMKGFEKSLEVAVSLTFFIPLLIGCAGNAGSQASAVVIRSLALKEVQIKDSMEILWKELRIGLLLGIVTGIAGVVLSMLIPHSEISWAAMGLTIGISILLTVTLGSVAGAGLPILASLLRQDPAVIAGPLITTVVDAAGLVIYFTVAKIIIGV